MLRYLLFTLFGLLGAFGFYILISSSDYPSIKTSDVKPLKPNSWSNSIFFKSSKNPKLLYELIDEHIICLENRKNVLPLSDLNTNTHLITIGGNSDALLEGINLFMNIDHKQVYNEADSLFSAVKTDDRLIVSIHANPNKNLKIDEWVLKSFSNIPECKESLLLIFGDLEGIKLEYLQKFDAVVLAPENHSIMQQRTAQKLFGALSIQGTLKQPMLGYPTNYGIKIPQNGRLSFIMPEELGISSKSFDKIDQIAKLGITSGAYPGCQIVVAVKGNIIYRKSFGKYTYDASSIKVNNESMYDIASITKVASSTLITMKLFFEKKLVLDKKLGDYIPEILKNTNYKSIVIREMMCHQAGLEPFIQFYKKTMQNGVPSHNLYAVNKDGVFTNEVADNLFLNSNYKDTMYARILATPLKGKKYVYSDLCYYFMQPIIEKLTGMPQDNYLSQFILKPMGLRFINYKPLRYYKKEQIVPTEDDQYFRKQLLWGHVHDPGAAMLGGVAGHAGLFSNATDLAQIMQLFLNGGKIAGHQFFDESTVKEFTRAQFPGNKRGVGFDRPNASGGGTCDELASQKSFGHSGFTGTLAWADPKNEVVFVFLSNRVHPSQDNWKIRDMNIRTKIQHVVYEIVNARYGN